MSTQNLSHLFAPRSIAVIGASERPRSVGFIVMRNLLDGLFSGPIMPVHPTRQAVAGVLAYPSIEALPLAPDLAIVCTPAATVPELIDALGRKGARAAIVAAEGVDRDAMCAAARPFGLRILGGASLGVQVPRENLNAGFAHLPARAGRVAFVSQSGALCAAVLDWARSRDIGFSCIVSLGDGAEIDIADVIDHLAGDEDTKAILLHIEAIQARRELMPAARAAARNKPVLLIKGGRTRADGGPIGPFLAEALAAPDAVFDAAVRRAGALRVETIDELFGAVETLARSKLVRGDRLAVLSNGGGAAMMAIDEIEAAEAGEATTLSPQTLEKLAAVLPAGTTPGAAPGAMPGAATGNPIDLGIAAPATLYAAALKVLLEAPEVDGVLIIHAPNPIVDSVEVARAVIETQRKCHGAVLACWIGGETIGPALRLFAEAGLPNYGTIGAAVRGFRHLVDYRRNQDMLLETPPADTAEFAPAHEIAGEIVARGLARPDGILNDPDTRALLAAYGIPTLASTFAASAEEAAGAADRIGYPVALTVASPDLPREWDVGGVALNLEDAAAVLTACEGIAARVRKTAPKARIEGFSVQRMVLRPHSRQLMIGIACDPLFGPVLVFGEGGRAVELVRDHTVALPPLNLPLARQVIGRTRISRRLGAHGLRPAADGDAIAQALVRLSALLVDRPEIVACDINPLFADEDGVIAVDARIRVAPLDDSDRRRFSVLPYPAGLEEEATLHDGRTVLLRPIRPEDEPAHAELVGRMSPQDLRYRFHGSTRKLQHHQLARLTQIDYDREMAFIATLQGGERRPETLGVVRTSTDAGDRRAELAILVRSDLKGTGLGSILMDKMLRYHRVRGTAEIGAQVMAENEPMLRLARRFGFTAHRGEEPDVVDCRLALRAPGAGGTATRVAPTVPVAAPPAGSAETGGERAAVD
ncbi:bifunctional acetate--CoA ligase family protein/GNAT family N-acetyltransferase [Rhodovulum sp. PH10]|uniref:bifunctional acetate--CoA ligase family protein/GNAT family N-acetyltransferase n=1 Tax=Rhodovulum sp. PH10 TaxID=1187851 RepID=UPI0012F93104|nr:bifunctional acetate--CoA ligase family protein/GNAT family N-acetyltransferase [Rhodovulum sp. PH10]